MERIRRWTAGITVAVILILLLASIVLAVIGSPYFLGMLTLCIIVSVVLWVFMWFTRLLS